MFHLSDLEIAVITFNRKSFLKCTLEKLFEQNSPVRTCSIVVYDNHSTDGTPELLEEYAKKQTNFTAVFNRRNIGLSGNICKAMENASKKYLWILCDNDKIDWSHWQGVLKGLEEEHDIVLASRFYIEHAATATPGLKLAQLTFLPSGIYKTEKLTDVVMAWAVNDTYTVLPHLALGCAVVNDGADIYVPEGSVITMQANPEVKEKQVESGICLDRTNQKKPHPKASFFAFEACEMNACSLLDNPVHRKELKEVLMDKKRLNGWGPFFVLRRAIRWNLQGHNSFSNLMDIYPVLTFGEKYYFWMYFFTRFCLYKLGLRRK